MKKLVILAVAAGVGLSACASATLPSAGGPRAGAPSKSVRSSGPAASPPIAKASRESVPSEPKSCEGVRGGAEGSLAQLVDVRVGTHDGYDRVTFEFAPPADGQYFGLPPYEIASATPPITEDGSGEPVSVDGRSFAVIVFHGASGVEFNPDGYSLSYTGPKDFRPDFTALAEARQTGDYEATLSWAFGLNRASCWSVHVLDDPLRVAVDFPHG